MCKRVSKSDHLALKEGGSENLKICVTSFVDGPWTINAGGQRAGLISHPKHAILF